MRRFAWVTLCALASQRLPAQDAIRITAQTLSTSTTRAMFGKLPKAVKAAAVQVCNQGPDALSVPIGRITQQVKLTNGITVLPRDAALVVVAQAQGRSGWNGAFRWIGAGTSTIGTLAMLRVLDANSSWGSAIVFVTSIVGVAAQQFSGAAQTHSLLAITSEALPDPMQLPAAGCASGVALVEVDARAQSLDFTMPIQAAPR